MNIFSNSIPNKINTFSDTDPPWRYDDIKDKVKWEHKLYHRYLKNQWNNKDFTKLDLRNKIDNLIYSLGRNIIIID